MTKKDKAYFAGFFDGEGYVGLYSNSKTSEAIRVIIGQSKVNVLNELKEKWEGSVYMRLEKKTGREYYVWEIRSRKAEKFLIDIYPYVRVKKGQIDLALEAINLDYDSKLKIKLQIKNLNSPMGFGRVKELSYH